MNEIALMVGYEALAAGLTVKEAGSVSSSYSVPIPSSYVASVSPAAVTLRAVLPRCWKHQVEV